YEPLDFVIRLANETAIVLLNGDGFDGPEWSVRVSLANLNDDDYLKIGTAIRKILDQYHADYLAQAKGK
ncbi:MAG: aspartate 4-decarboxylase, partial [Muribaculaceae bacterium]|nr:aspartate 4-decarboxylase [Muribaculaceae bacterium]